MHSAFIILVTYCLSLAEDVGAVGYQKTLVEYVPLA